MAHTILTDGHLSAQLLPLHPSPRKPRSRCAISRTVANLQLVPVQPSVTVGTIEARSIVEPTRFITRHLQRRVEVLEGVAEHVDPIGKVVTVSGVSPSISGRLRRLIFCWQTTLKSRDKFQKPQCLTTNWFMLSALKTIPSASKVSPSMLAF